VCIAFYNTTLTISINSKHTFQHFYRRSNEHLRIRHATLNDVQTIVELVNHYATMGEMLHRSFNQIAQNIRNYVVADDDGNVIGCGALDIAWGDLAEIRSLAITEAYQGKGVGSRIVRALMRDAQELGVKNVFCLTYKPQFFERFGFRVVEKQTLPHKVWTFCIDCDKFPVCDEVALQVSVEEWAELERKHREMRVMAK
jgi:amino-acid N-acetyltransferase